MKNNNKVAMEVSIRKQIATSFLLAMTSFVETMLAATTSKKTRHYEGAARGNLSAIKSINKIVIGVSNSKQIATLRFHLR